MIPILYDHFETSFTSNGLGRLEECLSCKVTEVINGEYELEFSYPVSGKWFDTLVNLGCIVAVTHDNNGDLQPFDVYRYSAPIDGVVTFYAQHLSYRLNNVIMGRATPSSPEWYGFNPEQVFAKIPTLALTPCPFTFTDFSAYEISPDISQRTMFMADGRSSVRDAFLNGYRADSEFFGSEALYKLFPGEFKWDVWNVSYYRKRGSNKGVQIRYGKNMTEVTRERDTSNLASAVFPFWTTIVESGGISNPTFKFGSLTYSPYAEAINSLWVSNGDEAMETEDGEPYYFGAADFRAIGVDFTNQFGQTEPTQDQLTQAAMDYMSKNSTWRAFDNITVKFADLYKAGEFAEFSNLEKCSLGDYVDVFYVALGIVSKDVEIVSLTYDVLADAVSEMELGEIKTTYAQVINQTFGGVKE